MSQRYIGSSISPTAAPSTSISTTGVWSLNDQYQAKNVGNWPLYYGSDPYFPYVTMLLPGNGTNGAQNNTFLDSSTNNFTITRNGNTTQGTYSPYGANWSNYFDGTGDYLSIPNSAFNNITTGTIECWVYLTSITEACIIAKQQNGVTTQGLFTIGKYADTGGTLTTGTPGVLYWHPTNSSPATASSSAAISANTWTHIAIVFSSTAVNFYINGVASGSASGNYSLPSNTNPTPTIGQWTADGAQKIGTTGYISNLRITASAVYSSAFTPSTAPLNPIANTLLLTCQTSRLVDSSPNNFAITKTGDTNVQRFSPFEPVVTTTSYYSGYFGGVGNYLSAPTSTSVVMSTGDFTIEAWIYLSGNNAPTRGDSNKTATVVDIGGPSDTYTFSILGNATTTGTGFEFYNSATTFGSTVAVSISQYTWHHVAFVRSGNTLTAYLDGVGYVLSTGLSGVSFGSSNSTKIGGSWGISGNFLNEFKGSISNVRITKGAALYTSTFTPSTSPLTTTVSSGTVSLLTCQNSTFIDNSVNAFAITVTGSTQPIATAPFASVVTPLVPYSSSLIGGSAYFDGTGDYLTGPASANLAIGTSPYTIEFWIYFNTVTATNEIFRTSTDSVTGRLAVYYNAGSLQIVATGGAGGTSASYTFLAGQWYHFAATRDSSNNQRLFVNGALLATATSTNSYSQNGFTLGAGQASGFVNGYISNLRLVNGTAVYTSSFTPPVAPITAITNTQLLVNGTNAGIIDNAEINVLETVGDVKISTAQYKFGSSSIYFDGTGDYLTKNYDTSGVFGTGNFTVEMWGYFAVNPSTTSMMAIDTRNSLQTSNWVIGIGLVSANGKFGWYTGSATTIEEATASSVANTWFHLAYTRSGTTGRLFVNGVQVATGTDSTNYSVIPTISYIGGRYNQVSMWNGYISDMRITKGIARYTANFTPPTTALPTV